MASQEMTLVKSFALALAVVSLFLIGAGEPAGKAFTSPEYEFTAAFPGEPQQTTGVFDGKPGRNFAAADPVAGLVFVIQCIDGLPQPTSKADERKALDGAGQGIAEHGKAIIKSQRDLTFGGAPAREFLVDLPEGKAALVRICLAKNRGYTGTVVALNPEALKSPSVGKFLDSFQLLNYSPPVLPETNLAPLFALIFLGFVGVVFVSGVVGLILWLRSGQTPAPVRYAPLPPGVVDLAFGSRGPMPGPVLAPFLPPPEEQYPRFLADIAARFPQGVDGGPAFLAFIATLIAGFSIPLFQNWIGAILVIGLAILGAYGLQRWRDRRQVRSWFLHTFLPEVEGHHLDLRQVLDHMAKIRPSSPARLVALSRARPLLLQVLQQSGRDPFTDLAPQG